MPYKPPFNSVEEFNTLFTRHYAERARQTALYLEYNHQRFTMPSLFFQLLSTRSSVDISALSILTLPRRLPSNQVRNISKIWPVGENQDSRSIPSKLSIEANTPLPTIPENSVPKGLFL
jgi:hypothetical protein